MLLSPRKNGLTSLFKEVRVKTLWAHSLLQHLLAGTLVKQVPSQGGLPSLHLHCSMHSRASASFCLARSHMCKLGLGLCWPGTHLWGSPKASHIKASHPHFPHFPRFRVRIFRIFPRFPRFCSSESPQTLVFLG